MSKNIFLFPLIILLCLALFVGCSSTPEEPVETTETEPVISQGGEEGIPTEETNYGSVNKTGLDALNSARDAALASGADSLFPEEFALIEAAYEIAKLAAADDSLDQTVVLANVQARYKALEQLAKAEGMKAKIKEYNFASKNPEAMAQGDAEFAAAKAALLLEASGSEAVVRASSACTSYGAVLSAGFKELVGGAKEKAYAQKEKADSIKSDKADKEAYSSAAKILSGADKAYTSGEYESAFDGFESAEKHFGEIYNRVLEKRAAAQAAIERAKQKVNNTAEFAAEADEIAPLEEEEK